LDHEKEIRRLTAETLATETLVVALLSSVASLAVHDATIRAAITDAFDQAVRTLKDRTPEAGASLPPECLAPSLRIVEELRAATLGH
jgi:hypothetical protein